MQIVDILRDDRGHLAGPVKAREREMTAAGFAVAKCSSMTKRRRHASSRICGLAMN